MINFSYEQTQELIKFIEDLGDFFGTFTVCLDSKYRRTSSLSSDLTGFCVITDQATCAGYSVAIDNMYFDGHFDMCLPDTDTLEETKAAITSTMFQTNSMLYLSEYLTSKNIDHEFNIGEYGEMVNCEIYFPTGSRCDAFIEYIPNQAPETYFEEYDDDDDESRNYFSCEFTGEDLPEMKNLIEKTINKCQESCRSQIK